eukprot:1790452-Alexandrium_andersonii.AAC.1
MPSRSGGRTRSVPAALGPPPPPAGTPLRAAGEEVAEEPLLPPPPSVCLCTGLLHPDRSRQ